MPILIRSVFIVDGSLRKPYKADVLIDKGAILSIGDIQERGKYEVVEGRGRYLAPGFIDIEYQGPNSFVLSDNGQEKYLEKGITTLVVGHGGRSLAPLFKDENIIEKHLNRNWGSFKDFRDTLKNNRFGVHFASLAGDLNIRSALGYLYKGEMSAIERNTFLNTLYNSLSAGALGVSCSIGGGSYLHLDDFRKMSSFTLKHGRMISAKLLDKNFKLRKEFLLTLLREKRKVGKGAVFISNISSDDLSYLKRSRALGEVLGSIEPRSESDFVTLASSDNLFITNGGGNGRNFKKLLEAGLRKKYGFTVEKSVYKITQNPALRMGLFDSYEIKSGMRADLVMFDSLTNIEGVWVNGKNILKEKNALEGKLHYVA